MTDIWRLSAFRVADLIAQRKLPAVEVTQAALARFGALKLASTP